MTYTKHGYSIDSTTGGVVITPAGGQPIYVPIQNFDMLNIGEGNDNYHAYIEQHAVGTTSEMSFSDVWRNLKEAPAPVTDDTFTCTIKEDGDISTVPVFGTVKHYTHEAENMIVNVTVQGEHVLFPGVVVRYLHQDGDIIYVTSFGVGNGPASILNTGFADWVWGDNVERIRDETLSGNTACKLYNQSKENADILNNLQGQFIAIQERRDPLVIDFDRDGVIEVTNPSTSSIYFDMDNDQFAEAVSWVSGQDALLVRDLNNNGNIDNANELFGTSTLNGFAVLKSIDSNNDDVIDASDAAWSTLKVWNDANGDGYTQDGELYTLTELGYTSIAIPATGVANSTITTTEGSVAIGQRDFFMDDVNTKYVGEYDLDIRAMFLPTLRGYSQVKDLHIQMSIDNVGIDSALTKMESLAAQTIEEFFADFAANKGAFDLLLFRWAGVDAINPSSRGIYMDDARKLEFLEAYLGENFEQARFPEPNPLSLAALQIMNTYDTLRDDLFTQFIFQLHGNDIFSTTVNYIRAKGEISFYNTPILSEDSLLALGTEGASASNKLSYWSNIAWFIESVRGNLDGFTTDELDWLNAAVALSDSSLDWSDITTNYTSNDDQTLTGTSGDDFLSGAGGNDTITGDDGHDTLHGNAGADVINGGAGNDFITGGDGHDELLAGDGNDTLNDGAGSDMMEGGAGDDLYVWAGGADDFIFDESGTDTIRIAVGGPITLERRFTDDLVVNVNGNNTLTIQNQLNNAALGANQPRDLSRSDWSHMKFMSCRVGARCTAQAKLAANDNLTRLKIAT